MHIGACRIGGSRSAGGGEKVEPARNKLVCVEHEGEGTAILIMTSAFKLLEPDIAAEDETEREDRDTDERLGVIAEVLACVLAATDAAAFAAAVTSFFDASIAALCIVASPALSISVCISGSTSGRNGLCAK